MLKQIDAKLLIQRTRQEVYVSGFGRKVVDFLWSPVIEREWLQIFAFLHFHVTSNIVWNTFRWTHHRSIFDISANGSYHWWQLQQHHRHYVWIHGDGNSDFVPTIFIFDNSSESQEMYILMRKDLINPSALRTFDQQFEIQFPLKNAQLKFHTKVMTTNAYFQWSISLTAFPTGIQGGGRKNSETLLRRTTHR